jgi:hypothetical protein
MSVPFFVTLSLKLSPFPLMTGWLIKQESQARASDGTAGQGLNLHSVNTLIRACPRIVQDIAVGDLRH